MLTHPTLNRLVTLGLTGMAKAFDEQQRQPDITALAFEERFALLVDREATERDNKRLVNRLRFAKLRQNAVVEDIDTKAPRGLDKALFQKSRRRMDRPASELADHRGNRRRQELDRLRARPQGLPRQPISHLSASATALRCAGACTWRRWTRSPPQEPRSR